MLSILSHEYTDAPQGAQEGEDRGAERSQNLKSKDLKSSFGEQLDEIAVFAFVAVAVLYIAAATYGLFW
jgi:hypothetical protein